MFGEACIAANRKNVLAQLAPEKKGGFECFDGAKPHTYLRHWRCALRYPSIDTAIENMIL